jgi:hypothetical protein
VRKRRSLSPTAVLAELPSGTARNPAAGTPEPPPGTGKGGTIDERLRELLERARKRGEAAALLPSVPDDAPPPPRSWADDDDEEGS